MPQMEEQIGQILMLKSFLVAVPELHIALAMGAESVAGQDS